ncbi:unnamed protein product [Peronospora belbahrii]|uniref:Uncharacterized protein n=1 Tax=Peronospora belbahrii TaxID=622444 RepID=A0AAU9KSU8_9STRA|nr:unnamed protein product [Peronospora belbahrii]
MVRVVGEEGEATYREITVSMLGGTLSALCIELLPSGEYYKLHLLSVIICHECVDQKASSSGVIAGGKGTSGRESSAHIPPASPSLSPPKSGWWALACTAAAIPPDPVVMDAAKDSLTAGVYRLGF